MTPVEHAAIEDALRLADIGTAKYPKVLAAEVRRLRDAGPTYRRDPDFERAEQLETALRWYQDHKQANGSYDGEMWGDLAALGETADREREVWKRESESYFQRAERAETALRQAVTLVRIGFLVTVDGERATADTVREPSIRELLLTILQAKDSESAARAALGETAPPQSNVCPCGYDGDSPCNGCPEGCKRRPAGVTGWDHIDKPRPALGETAPTHPSDEPSDGLDLRGGRLL